MKIFNKLYLFIALAIFVLLKQLQLYYKQIEVDFFVIDKSGCYPFLRGASIAFPIIGIFFFIHFLREKSRLKWLFFIFILLIFILNYIYDFMVFIAGFEGGYPGYKD